MTIFKIKRKKNEVVILSIKTITVSTKAQNIRKKLFAALDTLQESLRMLLRSRIFKKSFFGTADKNKKTDNNLK